MATFPNTGAPATNTAAPSLELTSGFEPVALAELRESTLLERVDRKFVARASQLAGLLLATRPDYRVLEVNGLRCHRYLTRYFDTPALACYHAHHAGRLPRAKVRIREYQDSGERYFEVKRRSNTGKTSKARVLLAAGVSGGDELRRLAADAVPDLGADLHEVLDVAYTRITLVHATNIERVTLDLNLCVSAGVRVVPYHATLFVEVKQARRAASPFVDALRAHRIRERSMSKYCLGVVSLVESAKTNLFRRAVRRLQQEEGRC
jgi:hypothetical protein